MIKESKNVKKVKVPNTPIEYLTNAVRKKFPRDNRNKKHLTCSIFVEKLHTWFYEIHDSIEWQEISMVRNEDNM